MGEDIKIITSNKKAHFEYFLSDFLEAGIELVGTEIKSLRFHGCSLNDSYILIRNDEAYIIGMNIAPFFNGNISRLVISHRRFSKFLSKFIHFRCRHPFYLLYFAIIKLKILFSPSPID